MADLNARIIAKASATAGEIPVGSDLDVAELAVNTADGKLYTKHSDGSVIDLSSGIGSTGVASVNGQAGAVTLGITDLSDVEQTLQSGALVWSNYGGTLGLAQVAGEWIRGTNDPDQAWIHINDDNGDSYEPFLDGLTPEDEGGTDTVQFSVDGGTTFQAALLWRKRPENDPPYFTIQADGFDFGNVSSIQVSTGAGNPPLTQDGDVIQYVESEGVYKNRPLPTYSTVATTGSYNDLEDLPVIPQPAPVDSVNGETGAVSLGLYDLNNVGTSLIGDTWEDYLGINGVPETDSPDGSWVRGTDEDRKDEAFLSLISHSGNDYTAFVNTLQAGDQVLYEKDGVTKTATFLNIDTSAPITWWSIKSTDSAEVFDNVNFPDGIRLTSIEGPGAADGQVLAYNQATLSFRPTFIPTGISNIQEAGDFALNPAEAFPHDFLYETKLESGGSNQPGEWGTNSVRWAETDSEGKTYSATGVQQFWISPDTVTWIEVNATVIHYTTGGDNYYYIDGSNASGALGALTTQIDSEGWEKLYLDFTDPETQNQAEAPLQEGDVLKWNAAQQKFKPFQLPAGGGGGAVDSVNGRIGDVSLGIQDQNDFELNPGTPETNCWTDGGVGDWEDVSAGQVVRSSSSTTSYFISTTDEDGTDVYTADRFPDTADALAVWYSTDGGDSFTATTYTGYTVGASSGSVLLMENMPAGLVSSFCLSFTDPAQAPDAPLTEGDILQWDNNDQKFKPAQPFSGSYNDLTDVPADADTKRIQDQDDFELNRDFGAVIDFSCENGYSPIGSYTISISREDCNGNDYYTYGSPNITALQTNTVYYRSVGDESWGVFNNVRINADDTWRFSTPGERTAWLNANPDYLSINADPGNGTPIPLAEGDFLAYNQGAGFFTPRALSTVATSGSYNDLADLPALFSGSYNDLTDQPVIDNTKRIQDQEDFELNQPVGLPDATGEWEYRTTYNASMCSPAGKAQANTFFQVAQVDKNGVDLETDFDSIGIGSVLWFQLDGGAVEEITLTDATNEDNNCRFYFTPLPAGTESLTDDAVVRMWTSDPITSLAPLAEGDILQWNNAEQKFKPAQLPAAPDAGITRIQDASDFDLNNEPPQSFRYSNYKGIYTQSSTTSPDVGDDGTFGWNGYADEALILAYIDSDGEDVQAAFNAAGGEAGDPTLWASTDGGLNWVEITTVEARDFSGRLQFWADESLTVPATSDAAALGYDYTQGTSAGPGEILVTFTDPTGETPEIPLATGDILEWQDSDSSFKPASLATVARSGSYNDLADQPVITDTKRIQDQDDFELNSITTFGTISLAKTSGTLDADGQYKNVTNNNQFVGNYFLIWKGGNDRALFGTLSGGDDLQFTFDDGTVFNTTFVTVAVNSGDTDYVRINDEWPAEAFTTETIQVGSSQWDLGEVIQYFDLEEGDILQWVDAEQKFKPAQPFSGSYNDLTDVPADEDTKRIQDQDDFALTQTSPPPQTALLRTNTGAGDTTGNTGDLFPFSNDVYVSLRLADGTDQSASLPAVGSGAGTISIIIDGTTYTAAYTDVTTWVNGTDFIRFLDARTGDLSTALDDSVGSIVEVVPIDFVPEDIPLAEGDVLQWVDAEQKFKPAQLPTNVVPPVDSVNGQTGEVSLDVRSLTDYAPANVFQSYRFTPGNASDAGTYVRGAFIVFNNRDADGQDFAISGSNDYFNLADGQTIYIEQEGQWFSTVISSFNSSGSIRFAAGGFSAIDDTKEIRLVSEFFVVSANSLELPPANDDVLSWSDADQAFKPGPISTVARSGSYNDLADLPVLIDRIQDQTDYQAEIYNQAYRFVPAAGASTGQGEWLKGAYIVFGSRDADGQDFALGGSTGDFYNLANGQTVYAFQDGQWFSTVISNFNNSGSIRFSTGGLAGLDDNKEILLVSENFVDSNRTIGMLPADNQILTWSAADAKWMPAVAASSRIQGSDDFALNGVFPTQFVWDFGSNSTAGFASNGSIVGSNTLFVNKTDKNGLTFDDNSFPDSGTIYGSVDGGVTWISRPYAFDDDFTDANRVAIDTELAVDLGFGNASLQTILISVEADPEVPIDVPLAEGDVLRWDNTDEKFKPASDLISLSTLQQVVADSTDFADFQARIAAL